MSRLRRKELKDKIWWELHQFRRKPENKGKHPDQLLLDYQSYQSLLIYEKEKKDIHLHEAMYGRIFNITIFVPAFPDRSKEPEQIIKFV